MLTTKKNELHVINSFNDLMKDTKEKQKINKMVKQYSSDYFMSKLADTELEDNKTNLDMFEELSSHYQKYAYIITRNIIDKIKEENSEIEEYYDGSIDDKGFQVVKTKRVFDKNKFGENFAESLEEEINNLVVEDYFKNLNKTLESYNFNTKIQKMKEKQQRDNIESKEEEIEDIIVNEIRSTYNYYESTNNSKEDILYNFKHNSIVINSMLQRIISRVKDTLEVDITKKDVDKALRIEIKEFVKFKELEGNEEDIKIPLGWKAYAITKFIDKMIK